MTQLGVWTKVHRSKEDFPNLYSELTIVGTATITPTTTTTTTITSTTILLLLSSSTSTSVCIQTTNTFHFQCLMVLIVEVLTVVLLKFQVFWDVLPY